MAGDAAVPNLVYIYGARTGNSSAVLADSVIILAGGLLGRPLLLAAVPTGSMVPVLQPGDLIVVSAFEPPAEAANAEVATAKELLQLHLQTERPVINVGSAYYLLDGATRYRFTLPAGSSA